MTWRKRMLALAFVLAGLGALALAAGADWTW
jgi:hypothetical protein